MVAIFTGAGNGLERGSGAALGASGLLGGASLGRSGEQVFVNAKTGNLVIGQQDEFLIGRGPDAEISRTYNSQGNGDGNGNDNWRQSSDRNVFGLTGTVNSAGSTIKRLSADGTEITYTFDIGSGAYIDVQSDGDIGPGAHDTLTYASGGTGTWTWRDGDTQVTETYKVQTGSTGVWQITKASDSDGYGVTYGYGTYIDAADGLTKSRVTSLMTDDGSSLTYHYNSSGQIDQIDSHFANLSGGTPASFDATHTYYTYDNQGRLSTVTVDLTPETSGLVDGKKYTTTYTYVGNTKRMSSIAEDDGSRVEIAWDSTNPMRVASITQFVTGTVMRVSTFAYDQLMPDGYPATKIADTDGRTVTLEYNSDGSLHQAILPPAVTGGASLSTLFEYADTNHVWRITDPMGNQTTFTYDLNGNMTSRTDAAGTSAARTVTWTYGPGNTRLTETFTGSDDTGASVTHTTYFVYDGSYHLRYSLNPLREVTEYRYWTGASQLGQLQYVIAYPEAFFTGTLSPTSPPTLSDMNYWVTGLTNKSTIELHQYTYDARGNLASTRDYGVADANGVPTTAEGVSRTYYVYDQAGNLLSQQRQGYDKQQYFYDGLGRVIKTITPDPDVNDANVSGATTIIQFDDPGMKTVVTLASGLIQTSTYNRAGDLLSYAESGTGITTGTISYQYDSVGRPRIATDALSHNTYAVYDGVNRKVADVGHDGSLVEYRYDADDRLIATLRYAQAISSANLAALANPNNSLTIANLRPSDPTVDTTSDWTWSVYDPGGRLIEAVEGDGSATVYDYDTSNQLIRTARFYNLLSAAQLTTLKTTIPTGAIKPAADATRDMVTRVFYDASGRRIATMDAAGYVVENRYDHAGRMTATASYARATTNSNRTTATYTQIRNGISAVPDDRWARFVYDGQGLLRYTVDALNQVVQFNYDTGDYQTTTIAYAGSISTTDYTYDAVEEAVASAKLASNPDNRRSWTVRNDAGQIAFTIDATNAVTGYTYDTAGHVIKVVRYATVRSTTNLPSIATMKTWAGAAEDPSTPANADNRVTRTFYDAAGQVTMVVDGEGYVTQNVYDASGNLTLSYRYDDAVAYANSDGPSDILTKLNGSAPSKYGWTAYTYDSLGRVSQERQRIRNNSSETVNTDYTYNFDGTLASTSVHSSVGGSEVVTTSYTYDHAGRVLTEKRDVGGIEAKTASEYDGLGNLVKLTDPRNNAVQMMYDVAGNMIRRTDALTNQTNYTYNAFGELALTVDARGAATYQYYDRAGRPEFVCDALGYITKTFYTAFGDVAAITRYAKPASTAATLDTRPTRQFDNARDATTSFTYDRLGRVLSVTDAETFSESYTLNMFGERWIVQGKLGGVTTNLYDHRGLLKSESMAMQAANADGTIEASAVTNVYAYDARGHRVTETLASGLSEARSTTYGYDELNRLVSVQGPTVLDGVSGTSKALSQAFQYDARGNLIKQTDPLLNVTYFYYDKLDRRIGELDALGKLTRYTYDNVGNLLTSTVYGTPIAPASRTTTLPATPSGDNRQTNYVYDALDRLTETRTDNVLVGANIVTTVSGVPAIVYDTQTASVSTLYQYDSVGNLVLTTSGLVNNSLVPVSGFQSSIVYAYFDLLGRQIDQVDAQGTLTHWDRDSNGNVTSETRYSTVATGTLTVAAPPTITQTPAQIADNRVTTFSYDRNGRRLTETRAVNAYVVDPAGSVAPESVAATITYTYNAFGEVLSKQQANGDTIGYTYDGFGRMTAEMHAAYLGSSGNSVTPMSRYLYDGTGNLVRTRQGSTTSVEANDRVISYVYDAGGRLTQTTDALGQKHLFQYDLAGRTIRDRYGRGDSSGSVPTSENEGVTYRYDALGQLTGQGYEKKVGSVWQATGDHKQYVYDAYGEMTARGVNSGAGETLQEVFNYDNAGRLWSSNADDGVWRYYLYDGSGNRTLAIENAGNANLVALTSINTAILKAKGNDSSKRIGDVDPGGINLTTITYDKRGSATAVNQLARELSYGATGVNLVTTTSYNAFGEASETKDAASAITRYYYNQMGRLATVEHRGVNNAGIMVGDVDGSNPTSQFTTEQYLYDRTGRLVGQTDANGNTIKRTLLAGTGYDGAEALVTREFHPDGGTIESGYDVFGNLRSQTDGTYFNDSERTDTFAYDKLGQLTQVNHSGGLQDTYQYDILGQRIRHTNNLLVVGTAADVERTDYDIQGRIISQVAFGGETATTAYAWDGTLAATGLGTFGGWTQQVTSANGRITEQDTDIFGHTVRSFASSTTLANRLETDWSYDVGGRVTSIVGPESKYYNYLNTGLAWKVQTGDGVRNMAGWSLYTNSRYSYDALGRKSTEITVSTRAGVSKVLENASANYDALGRMTQWVESGAGWTDEAGAAYASDALAGSVNWTYDAAGNVRSQATTYREMNADGTAGATKAPAATYFLYDGMNRVITQGVKSGSSIVRGDTGVDFAYDAAGRRMTSTRSVKGLTSVRPGIYDGDPAIVEKYDGKVREDYAYDAAGRLAEVDRAQSGLNPNHVVTAPPTTGRMLSSFAYDLTGRLTSQKDYVSTAEDDYGATVTVAFERGAIVYDNAGRLLGESDYSLGGGQLARTDIVNTYADVDGAGSLLGALATSTVKSYDAQNTLLQTQTTTNHYSWVQGPVLTSTNVATDYADSRTDTNYATTYTNTAGGTLRSAVVSDGRPRLVTFRTDALGLALKRDESLQSGAPHTDGDPHTMFYRFDGRELGAVGNDGDADPDYAASIAMRMSPSTGPYKNGAATQFARFGQTADAITSFAQGTAAGTITAGSGDSLQAMALRLWGDASLWYKLAEANALTNSSALVSGQTLTVPGGITRTVNSASTFRPYDPSEALGDTSPTTPAPQAPGHKKGCGVLGAILIAVVAIAITVVSSGAAVAALSGAVHSIGAGIATVLGTSGAISGVGAGALIAGGAVGGAIGSAASQGLAIATGLQDKFSWGAVAIGALSGAAGGALGNGGLFGTVGENGVRAGAFASLSPLVGSALRGLTANVAVQGVAVATGLQGKFDWAGAAAAGVGAGVGGWVGGGRVPSTAASGIANAATRSLLTGTDFGDNIVAALPDVIAQTIGGFVEDALAAEQGSRSIGRISHELDHGAEVSGGGAPTSSNALDAALARAFPSPLDLSGYIPTGLAPEVSPESAITGAMISGAVSIDDGMVLLARVASVKTRLRDAYEASLPSVPGYQILEAGSNAIDLNTLSAREQGVASLDPSHPDKSRALQSVANNRDLIHNWDRVAFAQLREDAGYFGSTLYQIGALTPAGGLLDLGIRASIGDLGWSDGLMLLPVLKEAATFGKLARAAESEAASVMGYTGRRMDVRAKFVDSPSAQATTPGHSFASRREAYQLALDPEVERVTMNAGYNRLLRLEPGTISPNVRPDVGAVYFDGRVARIEVMSAGDTASVLRARNTQLDVQLRNNNFNPMPPQIVLPRVR